MTNSKITRIHVSHNRVRKDLIGYDENGCCGKCHGKLKHGFGMAGGGFGVYDYCPKCEEVVHKTEVHEE